MTIPSQSNFDEKNDPPRKVPQGISESEWPVQLSARLPPERLRPPPGGTQGIPPSPHPWTFSFTLTIYYYTFRLFFFFFY